MKYQRATAAVLIIIYSGLMHPAISYGERGKQTLGMSRLLVPLMEYDRVSAEIGAEEGGEIRLGKALIRIPAGALAKDTEIRISRLPVTEDTGEEMRNVTEGGGAYRFEPAGTRFLKDVEIELPYEKGLSGNETGLEHLRTYFYDRKEGKWSGLERLRLDEESQVLVSVTRHFTDMINGTLSLPEGPGPLNFNINSIKSLEAADPGMGVGKLEGLEGKSSGAAAFRIGLEVPPGRRGMQAQLGLVYSSDGGNGVVGKGFSVEAGGSISIDTRWGLPGYDGYDCYMLDGVLLKETWGNGSRTEMHYEPLRESGYERIIQYRGSEGYWEVTGKDGTRRSYGKSGNSWRGKSGTEKYTWELEEVRDVYGN